MITAIVQYSIHYSRLRNLTQSTFAVPNMKTHLWFLVHVAASTVQRFAQVPLNVSSLLTLNTYNLTLHCI